MRAEVNTVLLRTGALVRATVPGGKRDHRGAGLLGARLRGACLVAADPTGADLRATDLIGADLRGARLAGGGPPRQRLPHRPRLAAARGDRTTRTTRLPSGWAHPAHWGRTAPGRDGG